MTLQTIKKTAMIAAMSGSLLIGSFGPAFAQTSPVPTLGAKGTAVCNKIVVRLNDAVAHAQNVENRWDNVSSKLQTANQKITAYYTSHNMTSQLNTYQGLVTTFTNSVNTVKTDAHNYWTALTTAQSEANSGQCGITQGAFKADMQTAKSARQQLKIDLGIAKTNFQAIKTFVQSTKPAGSTVTPTP